MKKGIIILLCFFFAFVAIASCSEYSTTRGVSPSKSALRLRETTDNTTEPTEEPTSEETTAEEHEPPHTGPLELTERTSIYVIVTILIVVSILFEYMKHVIEHSADESMKPIVEGLFKELTVLGFVALILFLVTQGQGMQHLSAKLFHGNEEEMPELIELVHFMLFGMMVMFIIEIVVLIRVAVLSEHQWRRRELKVRSQKELNECYSLVEKGKAPSTWRKYLYLLSQQDKAYLEARRTIEYTNMRDTFIKEFNHQNSDIINPATFDFNEYLTYSLAKELEDIVEIHPVTWVLIDVFILLMWGVLGGQRIVWIVVIVLVPYTILALSLIVSRKLHWIHKMLVLQPSRSDINLDPLALESVPKYKHLPLKARSKLYKKIFGTPGNLHQQLFWFDKHGPSLLSHALRVFLLLTAIFVCVFAAFGSRVTNWKYGAGPTVAVVIIGYIPVFFLVGVVFPQYVNRLSLVTSIEMMKDEEIVNTVLQRASIKKLVRMVKFISSLKSTLKNIRLAQETLKLTRGDLESGGASSMENISDEFKAEMRLAFDLFDADRSGHISPEEFQDLMEVMGYKSTPAELENILKIIDINGDGQISFEEFTVFSYEVNKMTEGAEEKVDVDDFIDTAFRIFDSDNSGHITKVEFMGVLTRIYPDITMEVANDIADEIDHDRSGTIDKHEFGKIIKHHMKELKKVPKKSNKNKEGSSSKKPEKDAEKDE